MCGETSALQIHREETLRGLSEKQLSASPGERPQEIPNEDFILNFLPQNCDKIKFLCVV